ncbi:MAG: hypothetical protein C0505_03505 [Leptothrix sp. (in: Bacteria)]|nr:hypothetical protein [Leptothrix sp. (in: b-proteobacteria)]
MVEADETPMPLTSAMRLAHSPKTNWQANWTSVVLFSLAYLVPPLLVAALIWLPLWLHGRATTASLDSSRLAALRSTASDMRLREIEALVRDLRSSIPDSDLSNRVAQIRSGHLTLPNGERRAITLPFVATDLVDGTGSGQLNMAMLLVPDTLLREAERTGDDALLDLALRYVVEFAKFERTLPGHFGMVRNDHAIAGRLGVVTHLWRLYRSRPNFDPEVARVLLEHVARCARFLMAASHYTASTNHGVMQNLALLQIAASFPQLPESTEARRTADERLRAQMAFFIHPEGAVLEHGPGYHRFGISLVGMAIRLMAWNDLRPIDGLEERYARGVTLLDRLTRPDGSLPRIGDTYGGIGVRPHLPPASNSFVDKALELADATHLYPGAGYSITARTVQADDTVVETHATLYWSRFPGQGHEAAAEGSFALWAAGRNWLGNVGYWGYDSASRTDALSWRGSSAPHLQDENFRGSDDMRLTAVAGTPLGHLIEVGRTVPTGGVQRQLVQFAPLGWMLLDHTETRADLRVARLWTIEPGLSVSRQDDGSYIATDTISGWRMVIQFVSDIQPDVEVLRGSLAPFGGWAMNGPKPIEAPALAATQAKASRWLATFVTLMPPTTTATVPRPELQVESSDRWSVHAKDLNGSRINVIRHQDRLQFVGAGGPVAAAIEPASPGVMADRETVRRAFKAHLSAYPRFRTLEPYRSKVTKALLVPAAITGVAGGVLAGRRRLRWRGLMVTLGVWGAIAAWLQLVYFAT